MALALTNVPAVSRLLWSDFLDDKTPDWFTALPTDIQKYLSGEFGPTTAASNSATSTPKSTDAQSTTSSATSQTAVSDNSEKNSDSHQHMDGGLPLWAKITIGVAAPVLVLTLAALLLYCCLRRRRQRRLQAALGHNSSRAPTPAFISSSHRTRSIQPPGDQHLPLRGGHVSSADDLSPQSTPSSFGGPSYDNIGPVVPTPRSRRQSRHSYTSLHSVPEVPEPMHHRNRYYSVGNGIPMPPPHRASRDSQDMSGFGAHQPALNPVYNDYGGEKGTQMETDPSRVGQGIYAGGSNPYPRDSYHPYSPDSHHPYNSDSHNQNPFTENEQSGSSYHAYNADSNTQNPFAETQQSGDTNWPLWPVQGGGGYNMAGYENRRGHHHSKDIVYEI